MRSTTLQTVFHDTGTKLSASNKDIKWDPGGIFHCNIYSAMRAVSTEYMKSKKKKKKIWTTYLQEGSEMESLSVVTNHVASSSLTITPIKYCI